MNRTEKKEEQQQQQKVASQFRTTRIFRDRQELQNRSLSSSSTSLAYDPTLVSYTTVAINMLTGSLRLTTSRSRLNTGNTAPSSAPIVLQRFFSAATKQHEAQEEGNHEEPTNRTEKSAPSLPIDFADISRADIAIRGGVKRTTCEKSPFISELVGANVYLKSEFRQFTGSFKERGARNAILQLKRTKGDDLQGVIAASAGNHALALAYHGALLGVPATVVMPTVAPMSKVDKCRVRYLTSFSMS